MSKQNIMTLKQLAAAPAVEVQYWRTIEIVDQRGVREKYHQFTVNDALIEGMSPDGSAGAITVPVRLGASKSEEVAQAAAQETVDAYRKRGELLTPQISIDIVSAGKVFNHVI